MKNIWNFYMGTLVLISKGSKAYYCWVLFLLCLIAIGAFAYSQQLNEGLIVTSMRDQVSWGFYISNFTFLVGVAAAAVLLVIPAYVYHWKPIKEIVILGELLAISAIVMCLLFVLVDTAGGLASGSVRLRSSVTCKARLHPTITGTSRLETPRKRQRAVFFADFQGTQASTASDVSRSEYRV